MQSSKEIKRKLGKFTFSFSSNIKFEESNSKDYSTITFFIENNRFYDKFSKYEIVNNPYLGYRLLVTDPNGWQDVPFKKETFWLLSPEIKVVEEV